MKSTCPKCGKDLDSYICKNCKFNLLENRFNIFSIITPTQQNNYLNNINTIDEILSGKFDEYRR